MLGGVLHSMKTSASKRQIMQSLASMYPCNETLFKRGLVPSPVCTLFGDKKESLSPAGLAESPRRARREAPKTPEARGGARPRFNSRGANLGGCLWYSG